MTGVSKVQTKGDLVGVSPILGKIGVSGPNALVQLEEQEVEKSQAE